MHSPVAVVGLGDHPPYSVALEEGGDERPHRLAREPAPLVGWGHGDADLGGAGRVGEDVAEAVPDQPAVGPIGEPELHPLPDPPESGAGQLGQEALGVLQRVADVPGLKPGDAGVAPVGDEGGKIGGAEWPDDQARGDEAAAQDRVAVARTTITVLKPRPSTW